MSSPSPSEPIAVPVRPNILIVEDNRADVFLIRESIEAAQLNAGIEIAPDGDRAIRLLEQSEAKEDEPALALVILDINLPRKSGREVLQQMRRNPRHANTPVIVVTSSGSERDREDMRRLGANEYFRKPSDYWDFMKLGEIVKEMLRDHNSQQD